MRGTALAIPAFALLSTVRRWGVRTLGDLTHLPSAELFERLGVGGLTLQRFARGEDEGPLVPAPVEERFESSLALEWPVEGLEPLSFVLSRVFDQLCARLERAGVGAAVIHVRLKLVTREIQTRTLQLPTPLRDPGCCARSSCSIWNRTLRLPGSTRSRWSSTRCRRAPSSSRCSNARGPPRRKSRH